MIITTPKGRVKRVFFDKATGEVYDSICGIPREKELNQSALAAFLKIGFVPGNETLFEGIQCLPGGAEIEIQDGQWKIIRKFSYENLINKEAYLDLTEDELISEGKKRLLEVIERLYKPNSEIVVAVSGGFDSRAILAGLSEYSEAKNINTYTFGLSGSYDFEIGNKVCDYLGTKHTKSDLTKLTVTPEMLEKICVLSDGNANLFFSAHLVPIVEKFGHNVECWNGYMGGEFAGSFLPESPSSTYQEAIEKYFIREAKKLSLEEPTCDELCEFTGLITSEPEDKDKFSYDEQLDCYNKGERCWANHYFLSGYNYVTPFIDDKWIEFILSVPNRYRAGKYIYKRILKRSFPKLFSLPVKANNGLPLGASALQVKMQRIKHRIASVIGGSGHPSINYMDVKKELRRESAIKDIAKASLNDIKKRGIIEQERLERLWNEHQSKVQDNSSLLTHIASLEFILRAFKVK
ncbi:MAG: asparagine synthase-related protein [Planctomycetota bacterium]|jgi:asparagine synthase (glutamine-hydrolysing)